MVLPNYASRKRETFGVQSPRRSQNHPDATTIVLDTSYTAIAATGEAAQVKVRGHVAENLYTWAKIVAESSGLCRFFLPPFHPRY
jgi:hypothetical protein